MTFNCLYVIVDLFRKYMHVIIMDLLTK